MNRSSPHWYVALTFLLLFGIGCAGSSPDSTATIDYNRPPEIEVKEPPKPKPLTFAETVARADVLRDSGQLPEAAWHYVRSMQLDAGNPIPKQRLGYMQLTRDVERAENIFSELVVENPELATGHLGLGLAHVAQGELMNARVELERTLELDATLAVGHVGLGMVCDKLGEHAEAQAHYELAYQVDPHSYEIKNNLGMSHLMSGNYGQAAQAFRDAIYLEPRDPALYNNLAIAMARQGDYSGAYQNFRRNSNEADALNNLGYVSIMNGEFERAIKYFERSLLEGPTQRTTVLVNLRVAEDALLTERLAGN